MATKGAASSAESVDGDAIVIYVIPGSQFSVKVLSALVSRDIQHFVEFVPTPVSQRRLPSGGTMVPEMWVGSDSQTTAVVADSEAILHWLDDHRHTNFFPTAHTSELSLRASTRGLAGLVWFYNWVNPTGYRNSMQKSLAKLLLPSWLTIGQEWIVDCVVSLSRQREKHATLSQKALNVDATTMKDDKAMHRILMNELAFFQSLFAERSPQEQPYLIPNTQEPTAVDFSVFAQLQRLVGTGKGSDIFVFPVFPEFMANTPKLVRLWQWYELMTERFPVQFKGKRRPKDRV